MKLFFRFLLLFIGISSLLISCDDENTGTDKTQLNKIVTTFDGRDTIFNIWQVTIQNYAKTSYLAAHQQLSVISDAGITQLDFYVNDTTIKINKDYAVGSYTFPQLGTTTVYFRNLSASPFYPAGVTSGAIGAGNYARITELSQTEIKGVFHFVIGYNKIMEGNFHSDKLVIK